jgi:hypothetical protein
MSAIGTFFKNLGNDIEKGISVVEPILSKIPGLNVEVTPILQGVSSFIASLEGSSSVGSTVTLTVDEISSLIQAVVAAETAKQVAAAAAPSIAKT